MQQISMTFTDKGWDALNEVATFEAADHADSINRSVQVYAFLLREIMVDGKELLLRSKDGSLEKVHIL